MMVGISSAAASAVHVAFALTAKLPTFLINDFPDLGFSRVLDLACCLIPPRFPRNSHALYRVIARFFGLLPSFRGSMCRRSLRTVIRLLRGSTQHRQIQKERSRIRLPYDHQHKNTDRLLLILEIDQQMPSPRQLRLKRPSLQ